MVLFKTIDQNLHNLWANLITLLMIKCQCLLPFQRLGFLEPKASDCLLRACFSALGICYLLFPTISDTQFCQHLDLSTWQHNRRWEYLNFVLYFNTAKVSVARQKTMEIFQFFISKLLSYKQKSYFYSWYYLISRINTSYTRRKDTRRPFDLNLAVPNVQN